MNRVIFKSSNGKSAFHIADVICVDGNDVYIGNGTNECIILSFSVDEAQQVIELMEEYYEPNM